MASQPSSSLVRDDRYAYMFRSGNRRFLFIRNFGAGIESVAQLVRDVDSRVNLIRKVTARRLLKNPGIGDNWQLQKPRELRILDTIKDTFKAPEPGLSFNIVECYGHEYIKSKDHDESGLIKYHSVSYWKLCNGRSLYKRWLSGEILPPTVAVARMIRQVLSTLHHLHTGGEKPIYHGDLHFGNIWMDWKEDSLLPDFYIGDFADAAFFDSDYHDGKDGGIIALPVRDLYKFTRSVDVLCELLGSRRGYGKTGVKALRRLSSDMSDVVIQGRSGGDFGPAPNLKPLIRLAQEVEDIFREGGEAAETDSALYVEFVTGERVGALMTEHERALVVFASQRDALQPGYTPGLAHVPRVIHGPWQLVRAPDWAPVEGDMTHHRPNKKRAEPGEDLSNSMPLKEDMFRGAAFIEPDVSNPRIANQDSYTSSCHSNTQPNGTQQTSPAKSRAAGDDVRFQPAPPDNPQTFPEGIQRPFPGYSTVAGSDVILQHAQRQPLQVPHDAPEPSPAISWTKGDDADFEAKDAPEPSPAISWFKGDDAGFKAKDPQNTEESDSDVSDDRDLLLSFHDECEARVASNCRKRRAKRSSQQSQATIPSISVMEPAENRLQQWHTMLHGAECKCADHIWQADVEAMVMHERERRARGGLPKEADWGFHDPDGLAT